MQLTADSAASSPSADAANNGKDIMRQPQQEPAMQRSDQQLAPAQAPTAGKRPAHSDARVDTTPAASEELMAARGGDDADAEQQQAKRRKLEAQGPTLQEAPAAAAGAAESDDLALPDLSIIEALAAEIDALPRVQALDRPRPAAAAAAGNRPAEPVSRGGSSDSPVLPSMQEQPPASSRSLTFQEGAAADGAAARLLVAVMPPKPHAAPLSAYAGLKATADLEASRAAAEVRKAAAAAEAAVAAAEAAVAARKAAAVSKRQWHSGGFDSTLQHQAPDQLSDDEDEQMRGVPGYVPKWLREWRPKARAAAAAARANKQRHKAASAAAAAAAAHPHKQGRRPPGPGMQDGWRQQLQDAHGDGQHHKHLGLLLGALMEDGSPAKSQPAAAAVAAAGDGHAQGRFVFQADMLPPRPSTSQRSSLDDSDPDSPNALPRDAGRNLAMLLTSSAEPELPKAQHKERAASRSADGSAIFTLPNQEWRKLSATAGLHTLAQKQQQRQGQLDAAQQKFLQQQERAAQIKVGCSNAHLARAVQDYRGVFAVEGTDLYEVRMYRSKLGKVLRLKDHSDAVNAARAFDRAALCLARASMGSRNPELNFPAKDYEGESLPDLRGKGPAEMREILAEAFSGHTPPSVTNNRQSLSGMPVAWPASSGDRDSPPNLPPPQPQQLQQWLPPSFQGAAEERSPSADKSGAGLVWGGRKQRSPMSPSKQPGESRQLQAEQGAKAGCAALMAAGLKGGAGSTAAAVPGARLHPAAAAAAAAAAATGTAPVTHTGQAVARQQVLQAAPGAVPPQQRQQQGGAEGAMLGKMLGDLQAMSRHCSGAQACLRQFRRELTQDPAATEAAAVAGPTAKEEVRATLASVEACQQQESALQTLLADTMQLLQPALSDEERRQLQSNSVQLAPALDALSGALSEVCCAVLRAAVTQDAAACAAAAVAAGAGDNPAAAAAAGALAAVSHSGLGALQQVVAPALDQIPAGSARATRMARLSRAIRASQDSIISAKKVLSGQE